MKRAQRSFGGFSHFRQVVPRRGPEKRVKLTARKSTGGFSPYNKVKSDGPEDRKSHLKRVLESHLDLLNHGKFSDVMFIVGEQKERIPAHQVFLKARSSVFADMFFEDWNQDTEVPLKDVRPETFRQFLEFIYADTFETEDVPETLKLLQLAHKFDVKLLVAECEEVLEREVTLDNALEIFQAARTYEMEELMDKVVDLWAESLPEIETHASFPQLDKRALMKILKRRDLEMEEVDLFRLALKWAKNLTDSTVEQNLEDILPLIRFPLMTLEDFTATVLPTKLLPPSKVIGIFTYFGSDQETKKSLAKTLGFRTQERQHEDPILYVPVYPEVDRVNKTAATKVYGELKECFQLCNLQMHPQQPPIRGIGLSGVSVYCPPEDGDECDRSYSQFHIFLKSKDCRNGQMDLYCNANYRKLLKMYFVRVREGEIEDIEFDTIIPLKKDTIYSIEIEEIRDLTDEARLDNADFSTNLNSSVTVNIENICQATLDVHRNKLQGFEQVKSELPGPRLICKLGFQEL